MFMQDNKIKLGGAEKPFQHKPSLLFNLYIKQMFQDVFSEIR